MNLWRPSIDFIDFDWYEFEKFQNVIDLKTLVTRVQSALSPFIVPEPFPSLLGSSIYDYCFGKMCNMKDTERWELNFLGEISAFLLENGRYLQAYVRDVNKDIEIDDTTKTTTVGEEKAGTADTKKTGNIENTQNSEVLGGNQQQSVHELGDTLTVLNNTTTSTNYLASANEESYSRGSVTETGNTSVAKNDGATIQLGMENGASLSDKKDKRVIDTEGRKSPLTIAKEESAFIFRDWMEPLFTIIDTYFMAGGGKYA